MAKNVAGIEAIEGVTTVEGPGGAIISTGPAIERYFEQLHIEQGECARLGHHHPPLRFRKGPDPNIEYLVCSNCGQDYQRPKHPQEIQAELDVARRI